MLYLGQIGSEAEKNKVAALQCFQAMIIGCDSKVNFLIEASFSNILLFLKGSPALCKATLKLLEAIAGTYPAFMISDANCKNWLELLFSLLNTDQSFIPHICRVLERVGEACFRQGLTNTLFASKAVDLIKILVELCFVKTNSGNIFIVTECTVAIIGLVKCIVKVQEMNTLLDFLNKCLANTHNLGGDVKTSIKESLFTTILVCIVH